LNPVQRADAQGQYTALVESTTLDGYTYRHMVTFAKLPRQVIATVSAAASAVPAVALSRAGERPPPRGEPAWLRGPFVRAAEQQLLLRLKLEGRAPKPLAPPEVLRPKAPELMSGSEKQARVASGTADKLRALAHDWAKADPSPFVVLVARHGIVFMHEGFNGFTTESTFFPASLAKSMGALTFARAVDQGLVRLDDAVSTVLPEWGGERTAKVTFRYCFYHLVGFTEHRSHGGLFNPYLDNALLVEDAAFTHPGARYQYSGDSFNLAGKALELVTGQSIWRLLYENLERPFGEPVVQYDLGAGEAFTAMYLARVGQMLLQDGRYGGYRFFSPGFLETLRPRRIADFVPEIDNGVVEGSIGIDWMPDPPGPRQNGVLGPNVIGHGASSGSIWRVDLDHDLVAVIGRSAYKDVIANEQWVTKFMRILAASLGDGVIKQ
jgi:CubicO group peptidase (beta-lactamase class C family)